MIYAFGPFELDDELFELRQDGQPLPIQPKTFDLLAYLVKKREGVASREQLANDVWHDAVVSEAALNQAVMTLRKALGDDGAQPKILQTVRGRGYRFVAEVVERPRPAPAELERRAGAPTPSRPPPMVGRAESLASLERALARALGGQGGPVIVTGEAGIGKTRLVEELERQASGRALTLVGHCFGGEGAPDLWPWIQIVRRLLASATAPPELVSETTQALAAVADGSGASARACFRFCDVFVRVVRDVASVKPILLVVEDAHWADAASLELATVLAHELPRMRALLVVTYRNVDATARGDRFAAALGALARARNAQVIALAPLPSADLGELVAWLVGQPARPETVTRVAEKTGGNPLFLMQIAHILRAEATSARGPGTSAMLSAEPVKEAIAQHLATLDDDAREALRAASVFGHEFSISALAKVLELSNADVLERLDGPLRERIVCRTPASGTLRFAHALVRDVLYKRATAGERARLHGLAGEALAAVLGNDAHGARAAEVARHFVEAAAVGAVDRAVFFCLRAAEHAARNGDHGSATRQCEAALSALSYDRSPAREIEVLTALAEARSQAGDAVGAADALARAKAVGAR